MFNLLCDVPYAVTMVRKQLLTIEKTNTQIRDLQSKVGEIASKILVTNENNLSSLQDTISIWSDNINKLYDSNLKIAEWKSNQEKICLIALINLTDPIGRLGCSLVFPELTEKDKRPYLKPSHFYFVGLGGFSVLNWLRIHYQLDQEGIKVISSLKKYTDLIVSCFNYSELPNEEQWNEKIFQIKKVYEIIIAADVNKNSKMAELELALINLRKIVKINPNPISSVRASPTRYVFEILMDLVMNNE